MEFDDEDEEVDASGCGIVEDNVEEEEEDDDDVDAVNFDISHFAIEPSLLAVNRYLQSSLVVAQVIGRRWTLLLVVATDTGEYESCRRVHS